MMRLLLTLLIFSFLFASQIISEDLVERNCPPTTCRESESRKNSSLKPHCHCDDQCGDYGDCCFDAPNKTKSTNETLYSCTTFPYGSYFIKSTCSHNSSKFQIKCALSNDFTSHIKQMHLKVPLTSKLNKRITYGNIFCAFCDNQANDTLTYWDLKIVCGKWKADMTNITIGGPTTFLKNHPELKKVLIFSNETNSWQYVNGSERANCSLRQVVPPSLQKVVRPCMPSLNSKCQPNFLARNIRQKCAEYQSVVYQKNNSSVDFRNAHCALCNNIPVQNLSCYKGQAPQTNRVPFYLFQPFQPYSVKPSTNAPAAAEQKPSKSRTYLYIAMKADCASLLSQIEMAKVKAETVLYRTMNRTFIKNMTVINGTGVQVCHLDNETLREFKESQLNSTFFRFVVTVGCLTACTFLLLYMWNFFSSNQPTHINQKLLLSFAVAMLLGNVGFFYESMANVGLSDNLIVCAIDSYATYYGFLAAFLCISAMAFDISCSVWSFAFDQTTLLNKHETSLFVVYSTVSWILPALISLILLCYNYAENTDGYSCLLTNEGTLLWFFVLPLTVSMSVNLALYLCTAFVVFTEDGVIEKMLKAGIEFKLHTCLVMMSNVMWLTIVLAGYLDNHSLIVLFTACDAFLCLMLYWSPFGKDESVKSGTVFTNNSATITQEFTKSVVS